MTSAGRQNAGVGENDGLVVGETLGVDVVGLAVCGMVCEEDSGPPGTACRSVSTNNVVAMETVVSKWNGTRYASRRLECAFHCEIVEPVLLCSDMIVSFDYSRLVGGL